MSEELLIKVKKLHLKALSAQKLGNVEEAEAFLAKVSEICFKNNITIKNVEDVDFEGKGKAQTSIQDFKNKFTYGEKKHEGIQWEVDLINYLAKYNFCLVIFNPWQRRVNIVGKVENVELVSFLFDITKEILRRESAKSYEKELKYIRENHQVIAVTAEEARKALWNGAYKTGEMIPNTWKESILNKEPQPWYMKNPDILGFIPTRSIFIRSFLMGAALGIGRKLREQRDLTIKEAPKAEQVAGLVLVEDKKLSDAYKSFYKNTGRMSKSEKPGSADAYSSGMKFGGTVSLPSGGVGTAAESKSLR